MFIRLMGVAAIGIAVALLFCSGIFSDEPPTARIGLPQSQRRIQVERDSLLTAYVVKQLIENRSEVFDKYFSNGTYKSVKVLVDTIMYNNAHTKMFAIVILQVPNNPWAKNKSNPSADFYFDAYSMVGYRCSLTDIWDIYPFDWYVISTASFYADARRYMRQYYFEDMRDDGWAVADSGAKSIVIDFHSSVIDSDFWEHSGVWARRPGATNFYVFQTRRSAPPGSADFMLSKFVGPYPDSITAMFRVGR